MASNQTTPTMTIEFCTSWGYDKRAASLAEHILHSRHQDVAGGITLIPSSGGVFEITYNGELIYSKKAERRFPEKAEIDQAMNEASA